MAKEKMLVFGSRKIKAVSSDDEGVIRVYRRLANAAAEGRGCHLTVEEVQEMVLRDDAILTALEAADEEIPF